MYRFPQHYIATLCLPFTLSASIEPSQSQVLCPTQRLLFATSLPTLKGSCLSSNISHTEDTSLLRWQDLNISFDAWLMVTYQIFETSFLIHFKHFDKILLPSTHTIVWIILFTVPISNISGALYLLIKMNGTTIWSNLLNQAHSKVANQQK